jgi:hypothetical protein
VGERRRLKLPIMAMLVDKGVWKIITDVSLGKGSKRNTASN